MKGSFLMLFAFFFLMSGLNAQKVLCGYDLVLKNMEQYSEEYREAVKTTFEEAKRLGAESAFYRSEEVYTIPVVVHVVWKNEVENIADSVIYSQIDKLNEDYRRLNADADSIRSVFKEFVGDPRIEFELNNIIRVQTDTVFDVDLISNGLPDHVKLTAEGGSDAVDPEHFLNIWVCNVQPISLLGQVIAVILGYAYPPDGLPHWPEDVSAPQPGFDGVVIDFKAFGTDPEVPIEMPGLSEPLVTSGRTTVHEVGHYLGLRHVWGDGGGLLGGDSCGADDGVEDTPNTSGQAMFDCDTLRNSCIDESDDLPDMIENYMDYAAESCMNSFTKGQINIMRGVLENARCELVGMCNPASLPRLGDNKGITVFPNPSSGKVSVNFKNNNKEDYNLSVFNIWGQHVKTIPNLTESEIDLGFLRSGTYLLQFSSEKDRIVKRMVMKGRE